MFKVFWMVQNGSPMFLCKSLPFSLFESFLEATLNNMGQHISSTIRNNIEVRGKVKLVFCITIFHSC